MQAAAYGRELQGKNKLGRVESTVATVLKARHKPAAVGSG